MTKGWNIAVTIQQKYFYGIHLSCELCGCLTLKRGFNAEFQRQFKSKLFFFAWKKYFFIETDENGVSRKNLLFPKAFTFVYFPRSWENKIGFLIQKIK